MIRRLILYFTFLNIFLFIGHAQEVVTGLQFNSVVTGSGQRVPEKKSISSGISLELPFFDDFSSKSISPDDKKWSDSYVFINDTYSDRQITTGVATFDALDNSGYLYQTAVSSVFRADQLTSLPINLNYTASDEVWLSFFYQAGGLSDPPEANDSLTLQFLAPDENKWYSVWNTEGSTDQRFKPVILKVEQSRFLKNGFQFRFVNYASLSPNLIDPSMVGNCDIWNIDYVLLGKNRNAADTSFADVAFRMPIRSLLKNHEAMPWKQFRKIELQEMGSSIPVRYRNNDIISRNVTRNFEIWDVYRNAQSDFFTAGAADIKALTNETYNANLIYTFNSTFIDSALFRITCSLKTDAFDPKGNDTIVYYQVFKDYFAFDDGTAEEGYGINGLGSRNAMAAYKFVSFIPDTLRAVRICFNDSYLDANKRAFDLMVWDNNNGIPGNVLYTREEVMVAQGDAINGFYTYTLPEGIMVNSTFFVGWKQRSETFLNAGLDINTPNTGRQYYWINGEWRQSQVKGSLMIRPVVGDLPKVTSIHDNNYKYPKLISIWPNPATDFISINTGEIQLSGLSYVTVMDLSGHELMKFPLSERIDISSLHEGIYILITSINGKPVGYNRLIKTR
jgi:hypothetical protein